MIKASYTSGFKQQRANKCQIIPRKEDRKKRSVNKEVGENLPDKIKRASAVVLCRYGIGKRNNKKEGRGYILRKFQSNISLRLDSSTYSHFFKNFKNASRRYKTSVSACLCERATSIKCWIFLSRAAAPRRRTPSSRRRTSSHCRRRRAATSLVRL